MYLKLLFATCLFAAIIYSCQKDIDQEVNSDFTDQELYDNFFDLNFIEDKNPNIASKPKIETRSVYPIIEEVMLDMQLHQNAKPYLNDLVADFGYPAWSFSTITQEIDEWSLSVPFAHPSGNEVEGVMHVYKKDGGYIKYRLYSGSELIQIAEIESNGKYLFPLTMHTHYDTVLFENVPCDLHQALYDELIEKYDLDSLHSDGQITVRCVKALTTVTNCTYWYLLDSDGTWQFIDVICEIITLEQIICNDHGNGDIIPYDPNSPEEDPNPNGTPGNGDPSTNDPRDIDENNIPDLVDDCLKEGSLKLNLLVNDILNSNITFPCEPDRSPEEIITETAMNLIDGLQPCNYNNFMVALEQYDRIFNYLTDPWLDCIYQNYLIGSDNEVYCNTYSNFFGETDIDLYLQNSHEVFGNAQTQLFEPESVHGNLISIYFNQNQLKGWCEVSVVATFLHEGIHAELFRQLNNPNIDPNALGDIWDAWDSELSHHENMAQSYIETIAESLKSLFGNEYTDEEYIALAWAGLGDVYGEQVPTSAWNDLTADEQDNIRDLFANINSNCDRDQCQ